ncbi:hypothetical protein [Epilithonimonas caeni]|uniref:hypothetical protein n=1 Tax=Epilithonimonas caeni TaxID=365343 RepID=UPI00047FFE54|nr:hypothetical protein [Epilithonimonas caeni]
MLIVNVLLRQKCVHKSGAKLSKIFETNNTFIEVEFNYNQLIIKLKPTRYLGANPAIRYYSSRQGFSHCQLWGNRFYRGYGFVKKIQTFKPPNFPTLKPKTKSLSLQNGITTNF